MTIPEQAKTAARLAVLENYGRIDCPPFLLETLNGFADAALTAALPHLPGVGVKKLEASEPVEYDRNEAMRILSLCACKSCSGTGERHDADVGDISFNTWECTDCGGKGWDRQIYFENFPRKSALEPSAARDLALEEEEAAIDALRLKAFKTNSDFDKRAYFDAVSKWFQDRHYRRMDAERALSSADHADAGKVEGDGSAAARDVLAERRRQIEAEGWTPEHDDKHSSGQLAYAASVYALCAASSDADRSVMDEFRTYNSVPFRIRNRWPWDESWLKPTNRRRDLVKAGALILAEIERLDRLPSAPSQEVAGS